MKIHGEIEFTITERTGERVRGEMPITTGILNPFGIAHAGALLWFADVCATLLAAGPVEFTPGAAGFPLGINLSASFIGNQSDGVVEASAVFVKRGRRLNVVRTTVTGVGGRLLADVTTSHIPALPGPKPVDDPS